MRHRTTAADHDAVHAQELFRSRLDGQIDLRHPLAQLATRMAKRHGITLRQSYEREGPKLSRRAGGYAHAR